MSSTIYIIYISQEDWNTDNKKYFPYCFDINTLYWNLSIIKATILNANALSDFIYFIQFSWWFSILGNLITNG